MNTRTAEGRSIIQDIPLAILAAMAILLFIIQANAADGDLDLSFDGDGKVATNGFLSGGGRDVIVQPDGKTIVVGGKKTPTFTLSNMAAIRYNVDGSIDTTFGANGTAIVTFLVGSDFGSAAAVAIELLPDGKILLAGSVAQQGVLNANFALVRLTANGTLDTTFGNQGRVITDVSPGQNDTLSAMAVDFTRGKIYLGGNSRSQIVNFQQTDDFTVARYNIADGSLDTTFNGTGFKTFPIFPLSDGIPTTSRLNDIALQADGKVVSTGFTTRQVIQGEYMTTTRLNLDGSIDTTFGSTGIVLTNFPSSPTNAFSATAQTVSITQAGKIFVGGTSSNGGFYSVAQYNSDGSLDTTFGAGGTLRAAGVPIVDSVIQPNGKIVVVGRTSPSANSNFFISRLNSNGAVDTTFGTGGIVATDFGFTDVPAAITLQADGKIVASGGAVDESQQAPGNDYYLVSRYSGTGVPVNNPALRYADFDGDGKADTSLYRSGTWFINPSSNSNLAPAASYQVQFGVAGDVPTPVDFDGDGRSDLAVWRDSSGVFYILNSATNTVRAEQFGLSGDNPTISGDWDGDGKADVAVYRGGAQSFFYYRGSLNNPNRNITYLPFGTSGDTPIFGDFDGDRKLDTTVYRPSENRFYVRNSSNGTVKLQQWGTAATDAIFAGDFDGDGKSDFAVQRFSGAEAGTWFVQQSSGSPSFRAFKWGLGSDVPVPADYDGDGKMDFAVYRRSNGTWYIYRSETGTVQYSRFGLTNDFPVPLTYVR